MDSESNVYRRIFAGVRGRDEMRRAIARAVGELRAAMEKEENPAVARAHMRNLDDIAGERLARAYALAEKSSRYWPSPAEIRELAGCSEEAGAEEALEWVFRYLDEYGAAGGPKGGARTFGDDGTGRRVLLAGAARIKAPEIPAVVKRALARLGRGSVKHGLFHVCQHPRVKGWEETGSDAPTKAVERIERQWMRCYRQALRIDDTTNQLCGGTNE